MLVPQCPLCHGTERYYSFLLGDERFDQCRGCGLLSHQAEKGPAEGASVDHPPPGGPADSGLVAKVLSFLEQYAGAGGRRLGLAGEGSSHFGEEASRRGFATEVLDEHSSHSSPYDLVVVDRILENTMEPAAFMEALRERVRPGGVVCLLSRQLLKVGGPMAAGRILGQRQRYSFSDLNLQTLMWKAGFTDVVLRHLMDPVDRLREEGWFRDHAAVCGRWSGLRTVPRLSVVLPVYNEAKTVRRVLEALDSKKIPGMEIEVVVVESHSTDGSREIVAEYERRPGFQVVYQDQPRGKGFAVREGLGRVTGEIVLIQDADLEYDFLDYEMLLSPILSGRTAFVLGSRHAGDWKIRRFGRHFLADAMNLGHWGLVWLINRLYGQAMTDPFTMYKVFRKDCLYGMDFECDRFDFDLELVCKLLQKGYTPLEIPVNYQARSFAEGKKVRIVRDPVTWLKAILKYRFASSSVDTPAQVRPALAPQDREGTPR